MVNISKKSLPLLNAPNPKKPNIQKVILKFLAQKTAIPVQSVKEVLPKDIQKNTKSNYALTRCVNNLIDSGFIEMLRSDNQKYLKITKKGKTKLDSLNLEGKEALVSTNWDGLWRIIILDLPESRKNEREALRYLLKKAGFTCIKNTVWISPFPYEHLFTNIKKDLGLGTELMIIVTDKLDEETNTAFLNATKK